MVRKARIRLTSTDYGKLEEVCGELRSIAQKTGVKINGPVPLPTKTTAGSSSKSAVRRRNSNMGQVGNANSQTIN